MTFWITLGRSLFAVALGVAIIFYPDRARPLLGNFIGGFWLAGSLLSLRWGFSQDRSKGLTVLVALAGALAGLAMVGRGVVGRWVAEDPLTILLGIVAILTGLLHISGHLQVKKFSARARSDSGTILGVFEVFLGLVLLFSLIIPLEERPVLNLVAIVWALAGGVVIFFDALALRREAKKAEKQLE